ncbi:hypothetical protein EYF80_026207 [Liparis tanakae]|uniref:Uncharacterized protein n=1 Tax=Liparis tanakae TaxID=230148 RepID=A0A4Z2HE52_9TELE|nr:hypothetical protein EYF80_026207 [Liparis tanakae]
MSVGAAVANRPSSQPYIIRTAPIWSTKCLARRRRRAKTLERRRPVICIRGSALPVSERGRGAIERSPRKPLLCDNDNRHGINRQLRGRPLTSRGDACDPNQQPSGARQKHEACRLSCGTGGREPSGEQPQRSGRPRGSERSARCSGTGAGEGMCVDIFVAEQD